MSQDRPQRFWTRGWKGLGLSLRQGFNLPLFMMASASCWNLRVVHFAVDDMRTPVDTVQLGTTGASGPGSVAAAVSLPGTLPEKLRTLLITQAAVGLAWALVTLLAPVCAAFMPQESKYFIVLYLTYLSATMSGVAWLQRLATCLAFRAALPVLMALVILKATQFAAHGELIPLLMQARLDGQAFAAVAVAFGIGLCQNTLATLLGHAFRHMDLSPFKAGAAISLFMNVLFYMDIPLPLGLPPLLVTVTPLLVGLMVMVARSMATPQRPPAYAGV